MTEGVAWQDGVNGHVLTDDGKSIGSAPDLLEYLRKAAPRLDQSEVELIGALVFFVALRDFGRTSGPVLNATEKALDSFYPVLGDLKKDKALQRGINDLKQELYSMRGEGYEMLVAAAYNWISSRKGLRIIH